MKHLNTFFIALLLCVFSFNMQAQKPFKDGKQRLRFEKLKKEKNRIQLKGRNIHRPFQLTLVPPISTNGFKAHKCVNHLSINLIAGVSAATEGIEIGGIANINRKHMYGVQVAGLGNIVGDDAAGVQVAGLGNIVGDDAHALQVAGLGNIAGGKVYSGQVAGLANIAGGHVGGVQVAGIGNIAVGKVYGVQVAGIGNVGTKVKGLQVAGIANIAEDVTGAQIGGIVNIGRHVKGLQVGLVNISDEMDGIPIGLISIARKNGYRKLDISTSEALNAQVAWKMGVTHFYNIFAVGGRFTEEIDYFSFGYGIGTQFRPFNNSIVANLEAMSWHVNEGYERWVTDLNLLNQIKFTVGIPFFNDAFTLYAGPSYNVMVSQTERALELNDTGIAPLWNFQDQVYGNTRVQQWVGMNVGVRF